MKTLYYDYSVLMGLEHLSARFPGSLILPFYVQDTP